VYYGYLADALVALHLTYVLFVVAGQFLILLGWLADWSWVRNFWFRLVHVLAIGVVALESILGMECPLTTWERDLRGLAGQKISEATFIGRVTHNLLFYNVPTWVLDTSYLAFAFLVLATFALVAPRWPRRLNPAP
jgi:hypothetical protein